ncbi:MAG: hypothetical protein PW843_24390 [Azospirillaceae bacterium]|nr:hypothetical protein [Azospirillaceae bacterium]
MIRRALKAAASAAVAICLLSACLITPAFAADASTATPAVVATTTATNTAVDLASIVTAIEGVIFSAAAAFLTWLGRRVILGIESWLGIQATAANTTVLNAAITTALGMARTRLDAALQGKTTVDVHNQLAASVAQQLVTDIPHILAFFGLDQAALEAKVIGMLGSALPPIQTVETPAPVASGPTTSRDDLLSQLKALLDGVTTTVTATAAAPAPAPVAGAQPATA